MTQAEVLTGDSMIAHTIWHEYSTSFSENNLALRHSQLTPFVMPACQNILQDTVFLIVDRSIVDAPMLDAASRCCAVIRTGDGYDNIDIDYATKKGIICCNQPAIWSYETAEYAFALGLMQLRYINQLLQAPANISHTQLIDRYTPSYTMPDISVGIVGFGNVGRAICKMYGQFVKSIYVVDPHITQAKMQNFRTQEHVRAALHCASFAQVLAHADILSLHIPAHPQNRHIISHREFAQMKRTAILINCSRGSLVDSRALRQAIEQDEIAYAVLDTTDPEPLPADHVLRTSGRVSISPHFAWHSDASLRRMCRSICTTVLTLARGDIPQCALNNDAIPPQHMRIKQRITRA